MRRLRWFSAGAASAIACAIDIAEHGIDAGPVAYIDTGSEHADNPRFLTAICDWLGAELVTLRSDRYTSVDDVIESRRYLNGPAGALCTVELKKKVREAFEQPDDVHIFGYTADRSDAARAERFTANNPGVDAVYPLIDAGLTKADVLQMVRRQGIELPAMYQLGYANNNCIGCVKGGKGYWSAIRADFPDVFARRSAQEQELGASCINGTPLADLPADYPPDRHDLTACSLNCVTVEGALDALGGAS